MACKLKTRTNLKLAETSAEFCSVATPDILRTIRSLDGFVLKVGSLLVFVFDPRDAFAKQSVLRTCCFRFQPMYAQIKHHLC